MVVTDRDSDARLRQQHRLPDTAPAHAPAHAPMPPTPPADDKPYHAKRPHRKSRLGCRNCKARKVKCDEKKPSCRNCTLRKETCAYPPRSHSSAAFASAARSTTVGLASALASASTSAAPPPPPPPPALAQISTPPGSAAGLLSGHLRVVPTPVSPSVSSVSPLSQRATASPREASTAVRLAQRSPWMGPQCGSRRDSHDASRASRNFELVMLNDPARGIGGTDSYDMRLLWFYTTETYSSFSIEAGKIPHVDSILKSQIVRFAFQSPFLMDCILGLSAQHMQFLGLQMPMSKALTYRARAFSGYRQAIERADKKDFPALLACSLLLCLLSSELFRERDVKPLYIVDWMVVWRGIGLIFELIPPQTLFESGLEKLFSRPAFDLNQAALHIPPNLLFMITSIKQGDQDYPHIEAYYDTLKYLGGLYRELENGFSPLLSLRIITWFTFLPKPFVELAKRRRQRALIILAHYLCFLKLAENVWWLYGVANRGIQDVVEYVGPEWSYLLNVPRMAVQVADRVELAKLIKGNHAWEPSTEKAEIIPKMFMVNDKGEPVSYVKETGWIPVRQGAGGGYHDNGGTAQPDVATPSASYSQNLSPPGS